MHGLPQELSGPGVKSCPRVLLEEEEASESSLHTGAQRGMCKAIREFADCGHLWVPLDSGSVGFKTPTLPCWPHSPFSLAGPVAGVAGQKASTEGAQIAFACGATSVSLRFTVPALPPSHSCLSDSTGI